MASGGMSSRERDFEEPGPRVFQQDGIADLGHTPGNRNNHLFYTLPGSESRTKFILAVWFADVLRSTNTYYLFDRVFHLSRPKPAPEMVDMDHSIFPGVRRRRFLRSSHSDASGIIQPGACERLGYVLDTETGIPMDLKTVICCDDRHVVGNGDHDPFTGKPSPPAKLATATRICQASRHVIGECLCLL